MRGDPGRDQGQRRINAGPVAWRNIILDEMRAKTTRRPNKAPIDTPEAVAPPAPILNGQAEPQSQQSKKEPAPPSTTFWEFLHGLGERWQTEDASVYIYRLWPVCDQRNPERFLAKIREPFDEEYLLRTYGSGKNLRKHVVNLHNPAFPPQVSPREVIESDPANRLFFEVWANPQKPNGPAHGPAKGETSDIVNAVLDKGNRVEPAIVEMWKEASKQRDELAERLSHQKEAAPPPAPQQPDLLTLLMRVKELQGDPYAALERLKALMPKTPEPKAEPAANPLVAVKETVALLSEVKELLKGDAAAAVVGAVPAGDSLPWWQSAIPQIAPTIRALSELVGMFAPRGHPTAPAAPGAPPPPMAFDPYRDAAAIRNFVRTQNAGPVPPTAGAPPAGGPESTAAPGLGGAAAPAAAAQAEQPADAAADVQLANLLAMALNALGRGVPGDDFADSFATMHGELALEMTQTRSRPSRFPP